MSYATMIEDMAAKNLGPEAVNELQRTRFIEAAASGLTLTQAAIQAGYPAHMVRTPGKIIPPEELRARFQEIAERKGLTLDRIGDKIAEHLDARANQTLEGKEVVQSEAPDYKVQQKAIEQLTGLIGMQDAAKATQGASNVTVSISGPAAERLTAMLAGI